MAKRKALTGSAVKGLTKLCILATADKDDVLRVKVIIKHCLPGA